MGRIISLDIGEKRTGIAITDEGRSIVTPLKFVQTKKIVEEILNLIKEYDGFDFVLIGLPFNMDGSKSVIADFIETKSKEIEKKTHLKTVFYDERLTSWEAEKMIGGEKSRKNKGRVDSISAALLLEGYLKDEGLF